ncbi:DinB superfamily protein [Thalassoglobus neptunius]|uniref:DinB superfamily protein n=1 Tax=Thalassoglobus neptunius TaxID=1938619 RepID=A0A5C5X3W8_9PLAN|nr:DinB family protein [Thalassoglobus neptunius]TWT56923.1 DinB superfamily protein [Thalassoglobus neptunius]
MNSREALRISMETGELVALTYLEGLTDDEMMLRPATGANHINWQFGHLILSEHKFMMQIDAESVPDLPDGFEMMYARETISIDDPERFLKKAELLEVYRAQRTASKQILDRMTDDELDQKTGIDYAPNFGALFSMLGSHQLMHAGQWAVVRRQLGRIPLI